MELKKLYVKKNPAQFQLENQSARLGSAQLGSAQLGLAHLGKFQLELITI